MAIIYCTSFTHLLIMTLHSELLPYQMLSYSVNRCTDIFSKSYFYFTNHQWKLFHVFKKYETFQDLIETDSHDCATIICLYRHSENINTNLPRASQISIGVIIVLSLEKQSLCSVLIGKELNDVVLMVPSMSATTQSPRLQCLGHPSSY